MNDQSFSIAFDPHTPAADREMLLAALRAHADEVQETSTKTLGLDWPTFVAVMGDVGKVAGGATALIKLGQQLWPVVKHLREHGKLQAQLKRPDQPPLDLATATEEELLAWLIQNQPQA